MLPAHMKALSPVSRASRTPLLPLLVPLFVASCGGEPPPPPEAPPAPVAKAAPKPEPVDVGAVPEPSGLVVQARIANPGDMVATLEDWMGQKRPDTGSALIFLMADMPFPARDPMDMSQPVDMAVTLEGAGRPKPVWAAAAALAPGEENVQRFGEAFKMTPGPGGIVKLEPKDEDTDRRCAIFPAFPPPARRLVCGESEQALRDLGPYLTRTRPRTPVGKDLEIEARGAPVHDLLAAGRQFIPALASSFLGRKRLAGFGDVLRTVAVDVIDFGLEIDKINVGLSFKPTGLDGEAKISLGGQTSFISRLVAGHPERTRETPAAYLRLPEDSESAMFGQGWDPTDMQRPKEILFEIGKTLMELDHPVSVDDGKVIDRALGGYFDLWSKGWVSATGSDWAGIVAAGKKLEETRNKGKEPAILDAERALVEKESGWSVWGVAAPLDATESTVKDMVASFNHPSVQKMLKEVKDRFPTPTVKITPVPAALKLPPGSMHVEVSVARVVEGPSAVFDPTAKGPKKGLGGKADKPKPLKTTKAIVYHGLIVPDVAGGKPAPATSWIGWGIDASLVATRLRAILAGEGRTLATRAGIDSVRGERWSSAGFLTARALARSNGGVFSVFTPAGNRHATITDGLPADWGTLPLLIGARAEASGRASTATVAFKVPRQLVTDFKSIERAGRR